MSAWVPKVRWHGKADASRKLWLRAGLCTAEVTQNSFGRYTWWTFNSHGQGGENAAEASVREAQHASVEALLRQSRQGGLWHIGEQSLAKLTRLAALYALEG